MPRIAGYTSPGLLGRAALGAVLDHLKVGLWNIRPDYASTAAINDGLVALSFVLVLDEP
jgi:succinate dehydrogenase hydrophobic anchor subunit